jgi:multicomponent K+:H+ antiporter subunit A
MPFEALLVVVVALPFAGSLVAGQLKVNARNAEAYLAASVALLVLVIVASVYPQVAAGKTVKLTVAWVPSLGLDFSLRMDGLAWTLCSLISGIGFLVVLYARYYMSAADPVPRFFSFLLAFMGSMLGIALSGNLLQLVFFWELTSLFSFLLIGYWHQSGQARDGARTALIVTSAGGLCLFAGILIVGHIVGSFDLDQVLASGDVIRHHALYLPALALVLLGAFTKSAQFPFQFWLPEAMAAPTPVSAYLHSATMVKAGVFLLIRLWPALGGSSEWLWLVGSVGLVTFVLGAYLAVFQHDLKGLLAYSTVSHLGLTTLLIGLDTPLGLVAAIFHMMNHAAFKASLFMAAGIIDHETGTRDMRRLSGLARFMPITASLAIVAAGAMAGVPLLNGFLSKEMFFAETIEMHDNSFVDRALPYIVTVASMLTVTYSLRFIYGVFFGPVASGLPRIPHEPPALMRLPAGILVLVCLIVGIVPAATVGPVLETAVRSVLGPAVPYYSLAVWHGFTPELLMSVIALTGGTALYIMLRPRFRRSPGPPLLWHVRGQRLFDRLLFASLRSSQALERIFGTRRLQPQLRALLIVAVLAGGAPFYWLGLPELGPHRTEFDTAFGIMWLVGIACAVGAAYQAKFHRLAALLMLGGTGLITVATFVWLSAPDLALTQLVVEAVTTVLLLLGLRWLPKRDEQIPTLRRIRWYRAGDIAIAAACGLGLAAISYVVMTTPAPESIARFFVENAYVEGGGTNIVNVILVDFRGFDTFGEITVLAAVALTIFALLRRFRPARDSRIAPEQQRYSASRLPAGASAPDLGVPAFIITMLFPVIGAVALYLLLRGHDLPGGGFAAGITMAVAFILQYLARGTVWVEARLLVLPVLWIGAGLLLAGATGAGAWFFGFPFLTSHFSYLSVPFIGEIPIASALLFDLGVFLLVVGSTVLMLIALAHQSVRSHRQTGQSDTASLSSTDGER